jgi:rod shape determining protein RodA
MWYRFTRFWAGMNKMVLFGALALMGLGWALVLSATLPVGQDRVFPLPDYAFRQALWVGLGLVALLFGAMVDYHVLLRLAPWLYGASLFLLGLVLGVGHASFGARRWFSLGLFFMQPGEFTKLAVLLMVVRLAAGAPDRIQWPRWLGTCLAVVGLPMALIASQPNLGTATLLLLSTMSVWVVMGASWRVFVGSGAAASGAAVAAWPFLKDYQRARILNFLNPYRDPLGGGYTVIQATTAIGSGGLTGRGFLHGPQNRLNFIPQHHTDFVASVLGEEFGFIGCGLLLLLYMFLYLEGFRIAHRARDRGGSYLAVGIISLLTAQTVINLGMNVGAVPITGLPLPFVAYGGSSLLINSLLVGVLLNVGRQNRR